MGGQEYRGYSIRHITGEPRRDMLHEDGTYFRPQVGKWYLIGDTDAGIVFLGHKQGYDDPGLAGLVVFARYHAGEDPGAALGQLADMAVDAL